MALCLNKKKRLPKVSQRILCSKRRILLSLMRNENPAWLLWAWPQDTFKGNKRKIKQKTSEQFISPHPWHLKILATALTLRTLSFKAKNYYHNNKNQQKWFILLLDMILNLIFCLAYCHTKMTEVCVLTASKINILLD